MNRKVTKLSPAVHSALTLVLALAPLVATPIWRSSAASPSGLNVAGRPVSVPSDRYLVEIKGTRLPDDLPARIAALGGSVFEVFPELNVVLVAGITDAAARALASQSDISDVTLDEFVPESASGPTTVGGRLSSSPAPASVNDPTSAVAFPYQWNMRAIEADRAWAAGALGSPDVRIAVIDTGIDPTHPDLADLIDVNRSVSFCPDEERIIAQQFPGYPPWTDLSGHGTWVASIAASKGTIVAGVTSRTKLMAVKRSCSEGSFTSSLIRAIVYSANNGADVINASFRGPTPWPKAGQKGLFNYHILAVRYALRKGVSAVVVAAGNDAVDLDHQGNSFQSLCDIPGVICVSATGPTDSSGSPLGPFINIDAPGSFSNFGASVINVAAPGGNIKLDASGNFVGYGSSVFGACATTDRVIDEHGNIVPGICSRNGFLFRDLIGTSGSAAHVSGLAALLVSRLGHGRPDQIKATIEHSADDLGKPGVDPFYGRGRINVARALGLR
jgi:subtilisin family serine protease